MKLLTWNINWAKEDSPKKRGHFIKSLVEKANPDVICFTEATVGMTPANGYTIESDPDYGIRPIVEDRRKVVLWSKHPWQEVDNVGSKALPGGRFVTGVTAGIRIVGICIPWKDAHVKTGRKDRKPWEDHLQYLEAFKPLVQQYCNEQFPVCITGDFNQRIPRDKQPIKVEKPLLSILDLELKVVTTGLRDEKGRQLIDHVVADKRLNVNLQEIIPNTLNQLNLSDNAHVGIVTLITPANN